LPCSRVRITFSSSACANSSWPIARTRFWRSAKGFAAQAGNTRRAAATAASSSIALQSGALAKTDPVAGFTTPIIALPGTARPLIVMLKFSGSVMSVLQAQSIAQNAGRRPGCTRRWVKSSAG